MPVCFALKAVCSGTNCALHRRYVGSNMQWTEGFGGGTIGRGHAMDFLAAQSRSLRDAGVPELYRRSARGARL